MSNINKAFFNHVKSLLPANTKIFYGAAINQTVPYYVVITIYSTEQPTVFCETKGNSGECLYQITYIDSSIGKAEDTLEALRALCQSIIGQISYNSVNYDIWENVTEGVRPLSETSNNIFGAFFETKIYYKKEN